MVDQFYTPNSVYRSEGAFFTVLKNDIMKDYFLLVLKMTCLIDEAGEVCSLVATFAL